MRWVFVVTVCLACAVQAGAQENPASAVLGGQEKVESELDLAVESPSPTFTGFFETQLLVDGQNRPVPAVDMGFQKNFSKHGLGLSGFLLVTDGWAEAYIGPTYSPADWVSLSLSVGAEMDSNYQLQARYATSVWFGYNLFSFLGIVEINNSTFQGNASGVWYDLLLKLSPTEWVALGWRVRRFVGLGPYLDFTVPVPELPLTIWMAYTPFDPEDNGNHWHWQRLMLGAVVGF